MCINKLYGCLFGTADRTQGCLDVRIAVKQQGNLNISEWSGRRRKLSLSTRSRDRRQNPLAPGTTKKPPPIPPLNHTYLSCYSYFIRVIIQLVTLMKCHIHIYLIVEMYNTYTEIFECMCIIGCLPIGRHFVQLILLLLLLGSRFSGLFVS